MQTIGTVILNYLTYNDTIECVASLKRQNYNDFYIIIVENGSNNGSYEILKEKYNDDPKITLIKSDINLGFAKGNNLGIRYARENLNCDYVFVLNSDTIVPCNLFNDVVKYDCSNIGVLSPKIVDINNNSLNFNENSDDVIKRINYVIKHLYIYMLLSKPIIREIYAFYKNKKKNLNNNALNEKSYGKYIMAGCSYFLTPNFFKYYKQQYPETFLYFEELNLMYYLYKVNLHGAVVETEPVIHKEGKSTMEFIGKKNCNSKKLKYCFDSYKKSKKLYKMSYEEIKEKYN